VAVEILLTVAGFQVPVIELFDVAGKTGLVDPAHIGVIAVNVGVIFGFTTIVIVAGVVVHCPESGLKV
jgi:hypothetical protein